MNAEMLSTVKELLECMKLQKQFVGQVLNYCERKKADRSTTESDRQAAMAMRVKSALEDINAVSDAIDTKISALESSLESMTKEKR